MVIRWSRRKVYFHAIGTHKYIDTKLTLWNKRGYCKPRCKNVLLLFTENSSFVILIIEFNLTDSTQPYILFRCDVHCKCVKHWSMRNSKYVNVMLWIEVEVFGPFSDCYMLKVSDYIESGLFQTIVPPASGPPSH